MRCPERIASPAKKVIRTAGRLTANATAAKTSSLPHSGEGHLAHQVRGDQDGAPLAGETLEQITHPADPLGIEPVDRLVEHHRPRVAEQGRGDPQTLPPAQGEASRALAGHLAQADHVDQVVDARAPDPVSLGQRQEMVDGRAAGVDGPGLEQRPTSCRGRAWSL